MSQYLVAYEEALRRYCSGAKRDGFIPTRFTWFRHSKKEYPALVKLRQSISNCDNETAKKLIEDHFANPQNRFNHHSFNRYFTDVLQELFPEEHWENKINGRVSYYTGELYRGMARSPDIVFSEGLSQKETSENILSYMQVVNQSTGISTSSSKSIAFAYARYRNKRAYVYDINYRDACGIDIAASTSSFFGKKPSEQAMIKAEVNIAGKIRKEDIRGCWVILDDRTNENNCEYIENPQYNPNREISYCNELDRRKRIFK
jgi:hypothetical protein